MQIFATKFSKSLARLLIKSSLPLVLYGFFDLNALESSNLNSDGGKMTKDRSQLKKEEKWNVEALYSDPSSWNQDFSLLKDQEGKSFWEKLKDYRGKLKDPTIASKFFDLYFGMDRKLAKLYTYAHLRMDEDLGNDQSKHDYGLITMLIHDFQEKCSWIEPELLSLKEEEFSSLCASSSMEPYRFFLEKMGRMRPHTLSADMEALMALSGKALDTSYKAFGALNNADLQFEPAVDSEGKKYPLSNGSYALYLRSSDRNLRKSAFFHLLKGFESHVNTLCELLTGQVQSHFYHAKARKFDGCLEAALFSHKIDTKVYESLISSVSKAAPIMHRYIALRKKWQKVEELHPYDLMAPIVENVETKMDYSEACKEVISSVALLGKEYQEEVKRGLTEERWVDVYETPRKRSGAYSSGCYDSMPYILLNYQGTLQDVLTLAHEMGHSMHSFLSRKNQSYLYSSYPIFVAEVASTFNEQLLLKQLKEKAKSKQELAYLINYEIEGIRGTIFRQTLFAEFELQLHRWVEEGRPITPSLLKEYYLQLNQKYYGPDLVLDPEYAVEWARIPHFYYNFYVYQYATGLSAAMALFELAQNSEESVHKYLSFLSSGGSNYPIELLKKAGVDMHSEEVVQAAMRKFEALINELEKCLE